MSQVSQAQSLSLSALEAEKQRLTEQLDDLRDRLVALAPELEHAQAEAAKAPPAINETSLDSLLETATQAALERHTWQAKAEAIETAMHWATTHITATEQALKCVEDQLDLLERTNKRTAEAQAGVTELNQMVTDLKDKLQDLKQHGCIQVYALNLPEFVLDQQGYIQTRPVSFRVR